MNDRLLANLTPDEAYRLTGTLPATHIEELLAAPPPPDLEGAAALIHDGRLQFPNEDFLCHAIRRVGTLAKQVRGDNRKEADAIAAYLEELEMDIYRSSEYGRTELKSAEALLKGAPSQ
jgi:hypothetical protein